MTIEKSSPEERKKIVQGINSFNEKQVPFLVRMEALDYSVKDERGQMIAGITAHLGYWGGLSIDVLFVSEEYRKKGIGSDLLRFVEKKAKEMGSKIAFLDTFDFQAKDFYLKRGYEIFGVLKDFPMKDTNRYYMKKQL
jgi:GNAT superfamily N-acetyltransferase